MRTAACVVLLVAPPAALADAAPPFPLAPGMSSERVRWVPLDYRFETDREHPDYAFLLLTPTNPSVAERVTIRPGQPLLVRGFTGEEYRPTAHLVAVPRQDEGYWTWPQVADAMAEGRIPPRFVFTFETRVRPTSPDRAPVVVRVDRVTPEEGLVTVGVSAQRVPARGLDQTVGGFFWVLVVAGLAGAGFWLARRLRRARRA